MNKNSNTFYASKIYVFKKIFVNPNARESLFRDIPPLLPLIPKTKVAQQGALNRLKGFKRASGNKIEIEGSYFSF